MAALFMGEWPESTDYEALEIFWAQFGSDAGKLLRYAIDFDPTKL